VRNCVMCFDRCVAQVRSDVVCLSKKHRAGANFSVAQCVLLVVWCCWQGVRMYVHGSGGVGYEYMVQVDRLRPMAFTALREAGSHSVAGACDASIGSD
jgi:hypothetical protein